MMFTTLAVLQVSQALAVRSHRTSLRGMPLLANRALNAMVLLVLALQVAAVYLPGLSDAVLDLAPLRRQDWAIAVGAGIALVTASEIEKAWPRFGHQPANSHR